MKHYLCDIKQFFFNFQDTVINYISILHILSYF